MKSRVILELKNIAPIALAAINSVPDDGRARWAHIPSHLVKSFAEVLRAIPEFKEIEGQMYVFPNEAALIDGVTCAYFLIDRAFDYPVEAIIEDFFNILINKTIKVLEIRAIAGISPDKRHDLGDNFELVPFIELPQNQNTLEVFNNHYRVRHVFDQLPSAAIVHTTNYPLILAPAYKDGESGPVMPIDISERKWSNIISAITLSSDGAFEYREQYKHIDNIGWFGMLSNGMSSSQSFPEPIKYATTFNSELAKKILHLLNKDNEKMSSVIKKLDSSRRRLDRVEQSMDLGTCLEIMLMDDSNDNSEINYKLGTRAAWLIGENYVDRRAIFDRTRELYNKRSKAIHIGNLPFPKSPSDSETEAKDFAAYDQLCVHLIIKILELQKWPNWKEIVMGVLLPASKTKTQ